MKNMRKKLLCLVISLAIIFSVAVMPVAADEAPIMYQDTITVTKDGGRYQIGFINIEFKKNFIEKDNLPITFEVMVYAEDGKGYIEFSPDIPDFFKKVHIRVDRYNGMLYDVANDENIEITVNKQQILAEHFSRYCFSD